MSKYCYLCGEKLIKNVNRSKDHVPPDCIFPDDKPDNLITVPCCIRCNEEFDPLDTKMRNFTAILAGDQSSDAGDKAQRVVLSSKKLSQEFLTYAKPHPTLTNDDGEPLLIFNFAAEELSKWLIRIVKGLYYWKYRTRINEHAIFNAKVHPEIRPPKSESWPLDEGLHLRPYFVFGNVKDEDQLNTYCWVLIFYDHLVFTVNVNMPILIGASQSSE